MTPSKLAKNTGHNEKSAVQSIKRRFTLSINPVETLVFLITLGFFTKSIYQLVNETDILHAATLQKQNDRQLASTSRPQEALASETQDLELTCSAPTQKFSTRSGKVRLSGQLCGTSLTQSKVSIESATLSLKMEAFVDTETQRYITQPLPLLTGENLIRVDQISSGKKAFSTQLNVVREQSERM